MDVGLTRSFNGSSADVYKVFYVYTYGTAGWLGLQALPLLLSPKLITAMLASEAHLATGSTVPLPFPNLLRRIQSADPTPRS